MISFPINPFVHLRSRVQCDTCMFFPLGSIWLILIWVKDVQCLKSMFLGLRLRSKQNYLKNLFPDHIFSPLGHVSYFAQRVPLVKVFAVALNNVFRSNVKVMSNHPNIFVEHVNLPLALSGSYFI